MKKAGRKLAVVMSIFLAAGSFQSWANVNEYGPGSVGKWVETEDAKWRYRNPDGTYPAEDWKEIDEKWYYFDEEGYMKTGWLTLEEKLYYLQADGSMVSSTAMVIDGVEYLFAEDGSTSYPTKQPTVNLELEKDPQVEAEKSEKRKQVDAMADQILAKITNDKMDKRQKANAIYDYVRGNMSYVNHSEKGDWVSSAYDGLRKKKGDCYTYYSVSLALLTRAEIPSIEMIRTDGHHWWNLINCGDGWYHFDTTPRAKNNRKFFMWTDAQLDAYNQISGGTHARDKSLYPATPEE